jgi:hypothetical protein
VVNCRVYVEVKYVELTVTVRIISNVVSLNLSEGSICGLFFVWRNRAYSDVSEEESVVHFELCVRWNEVFQVKYKVCSIVTMTGILSWFITVACAFLNKPTCLLLR